MDDLFASLQGLGREVLELDPVPLLLAFFLGGAIGFERELSGRAAGLRTHILVCLSSTLLILVSKTAAQSGAPMDETARLVFDPNRMAAGIVTGIGFLGAATVLRSGDVLRGLTTAACIWFVAGLGIVIGMGQYALAIVGTGIVLIVLTIVNRLSGVIRPVVYRRLIVITSSSEIEKQVESVRAALKRQRLRVLDLSSGHSKESGRHELVFYLALKNSFQAPALTEEIGSLPDVLSARWKQNEH